MEPSRCPSCLNITVSGESMCGKCGIDLESTLCIQVINLESLLREAESNSGPDSIHVAERLEDLARLLKRNKWRLLEAANMEARAKKIRGSSPASFQQPPPQPQPTTRQASGAAANENNQPQSFRYAKCPFCSEAVPPGAPVCGYCHARLVKSVDNRSHQKSADQHPHQNNPAGGHKRCPYCAEEILVQALKCRYCGSTVPASSSNWSRPLGTDADMIIVDPREARDPALMAFYSGCCIAGMGQMLLGQVGKGFVILGLSVVAASLTMGASIWVTWPLGALDAYMIADKLKRGRAVGRWECF